MARKYAQISLSIWSDDDFLDLTPRGQHLYFMLLTDSSLSFCGVADWRPKRLAARAKGWTTTLVEQAADELAKARYLVLDEDTEEVLIRSYIRNDEVLKQPNLAAAMVSAFSGVTSREIRGVIRDEVWRLSEDFPEFTCWTAKASGQLLEAMVEHSPARRAASGEGPSGNPFGNPFGMGNGTPSEEPKEAIHQGGNPSGKASPPVPVPVPVPAPSPTETASSNDAEQGALLDVPVKPPSLTQRISRLAHIYTDQIKLTSYHGVAGAVKAAIQTGTGTDEQIAMASQDLVDENRSVTRDSLRIAITGGPKRKNSITDANRVFLDDPDADFLGDRRTKR